MKTFTNSKTDSNSMRSFRTRLNESRFVRHTYLYLNHLLIPAQIASIGYSLWEWTKRKYTNRESDNEYSVKEGEAQNEEEKNEEEDEQNEGVNEQSEAFDSNASLQTKLRHDLGDIRGPRGRMEVIEELIEEEHKEALVHEQQEAWILTLVGKNF